MELLDDYFLVETAGTLVYPSGHAFLLRFPVYVPFGLAIRIVFMGYVGLRLVDEMGRTAGYALPAAFAFVVERGFESLVSRSGGWTYTTDPFGWIGHAPLFILVAEAAMFASAYYWVKQDSVTGGLGMGATMVLS